MDRFARVTHYSTFVSMIACIAVALAGFLTFGDKTLGNILVSVSITFIVPCSDEFLLRTISQKTI